MNILVTGATGYIGGRLIPQLLKQNYHVRCFVRKPQRLQGRPWEAAVEIAVGDVLKRETITAALQGIEVAYYLIHSMVGGGDFHERDMMAARNFSAAAKAAGVQRIIYLGGLGDSNAQLSKHLRSRQQTGDALRSSGVSVTEFQAGVIVGSGSLSFEMIRYLTERVPIMICPYWVYTRTQPIGIREILAYLVAVLTVPESKDRIVEIGGSEVISYGDMMMIYAKIRGLKRWMVPVPVLTPRLSSYWVNLVTPIQGAIARPLIEGLRNESIVRGDAAQELFPEIELVSYHVSVERALARLDAGYIETIWHDGMSVSQENITPLRLSVSEGMIQERRQRLIAASPAAIYRVVTGIGGERGWFYMNWAWEIRGFLDKMVGGVGLRRGRRDPDQLQIGDALDFWRVEAVNENQLMQLRAEMKVPGKAWLQFELAPHESEGTLLRQTAFFAPKGLWGQLYWYLLYPLHALIFSGLIAQIERRALVVEAD